MVVVQNGGIVKFRCCGDDQVGKREPVLASAREFVLHMECPIHRIGADGQPGESGEILSKCFVIGEVPSRVQDFQCDDVTSKECSLVEEESEEITGLVAVTTLFQC